MNTLNDLWKFKLFNKFFVKRGQNGLLKFAPVRRAKNHALDGAITAIIHSVTSFFRVFFYES